MNKVITRGKFFSQFLEEEKEILVLTETGTQGAAKYDDMWVPSNHPLAFIDLADNSLHTKSIRLEWIVKGKDWKYYFKPQTAYRMKVRPQNPMAERKTQLRSGAKRKSLLLFFSLFVSFNSNLICLWSGRNSGARRMPPSFRF